QPQLRGILADDRMLGEFLGELRERLDHQAVKFERTAYRARVKAQRLGRRFLPAIYGGHLVRRIIALLLQRLFDPGFALLHALPARLDRELLLRQLAVLPRDPFLRSLTQRGGELRP